MTEIINILDTFFPTDISKFILEKVDKDVHREKLDSCLEHVKLYSLLINHNKISSMFKRWNVVYNKNIIKTYFPDVEETLRMLNTCNCCERHKTDKPTSLCSTFCLTSTKLLNTNKNSCECKCRRLARLLLKYLMSNEEDIIKHERYYIHSMIKTDLHKLKLLTKHIENDISGIDHTYDRFSNTYQTYMDVITSEKNRIEGQIQYLSLHIQELREIVLPEDVMVSEYLIELDNNTMLNEYMRVSQSDYIDYPSGTDDMELDYSDDSIS